MKIKIAGLLILGATLGAAFSSLAQQGQSVPAPSEFAIELTVDRAANGIRMSCVKGCTWEKLSFACDPSGDDCIGTFDQFGTPAE